MIISIPVTNHHYFRMKLMYLGNEEIPALGTFAARQLLRQFQQVQFSDWRSDVLAQNVRLRLRLSRALRNQDKAKILASRRKYRLRDAVNELQYKSRKILEIADTLHPDLSSESLGRRLHFARVELLAIQDLGFSIGLLQSLLDVA